MKMRGSGASSSVIMRVSGTDCRTRLAGTMAAANPGALYYGKVKNAGLRSGLEWLGRESAGLRSELAELG